MVGGHESRNDVQQRLWSPNCQAAKPRLSKSAHIFLSKPRISVLSQESDSGSGPVHWLQLPPPSGDQTIEGQELLATR